MDIIDGILDLWNSTGDALARTKREARRVFRGERGFSTLVIVLVILAVGSIIITPLLVFVVTGQRAGQAHDRTTHRFYAADAGIQDGKWKVSSGDLPDWLKEDWDESVYSHAMDSETLYDLPDQVNSCDVTVEVRPMWILEGLETPSTDQQRTHDPVLEIVSNIVGGGELQIVIICTTPGVISLDRIGVWIPKPFTYVEASSNLGALNPAVTQSDWRNGQIITFDFGSAVLFSSLPGGTGTRRVITFDYTPTDGAMDTSWSWCRTNGTDPKLAWSDDIKLYQVESTATDPDTGLSTTVVAHTMTNESMGTYLAYYGDYAVTGNAIARETDTDRVRDRLYKESPGQISIIPESGTARKIVLYWSGWKENPWNIWSYTADARHALADTYHVNEVSLRVEYPSGSGTYYNLGVISPDDYDVEWTVLPNGSSGSPNGWSYGCNCDITGLVKDALPDGFVGNATYWVGHANVTNSPITTLRGVWGSGASDVFAVGDGGYIAHYNGTSWSPMTSGTTQNLYGVWGSSSSDVFAVGAGGTIRHYDGTSWSSMSSGTTNTLYGIWGSASNNVYAVGASGTIRKYTTSWATSTSGTTNTLYGIWGSASNNIYAVGASGTIRKYTTSWASSTSGTTRTLRGIWGTSSSNIYAVGEGSIIRRYTTAWGSSRSYDSGDPTLYGIWGTSSSNIYAVGAGGIIRRYNGSSWGGGATTLGTTPKTLYSVWGSSSSNVHAVGADGTIRRYNGTDWSAPFTTLFGWVNNHSGETIPATVVNPLSDAADNEWANASWSVITIYSSPETLAHQMYLFDTFRYWNSDNDVTFTLEGFLAPASVAVEDEAVKITYYVGEGDSWYGNGDNLYVNGTQLNPNFITPSTCAPTNNAMNSAGNSGGVTGYPPDDGIDLDTYIIDGSDGIVDPADSSATVRLTTGTDIWNMVYMVVSFRSDRVGSGFVTYIVE